MREGDWKIIVVNPQRDLDLEYEQEALRPLGARMQRVYVKSDDELLAAAGDADVVVPHGDAYAARRLFYLTRGAINGLKRCILIPSVGIGVEHIDVAAATECGILVTNMAGLFVEEVANHAWMLLLAVARRCLWLHEMVVTGRWRETTTMLWPVLKVQLPRITGQTLGLVAFGPIARATARRAKAFGMTCLACDPYVPPEVFKEHGVERASLEDIFRKSDFVSCHAPFTPETFHMIGAAQFRVMKQGAIFVNTGRGKVVDEAALIAALQEGRIAGAGLDVLEKEPADPTNSLFKMPNVVITPHLGSVSTESDVERRRLLGRQIADVLQGRAPFGIVNKEVLSGGRFHASISV